MYTVGLTETLPEMKGLWDCSPWKEAETLDLSYYRAEGSKHRPKTLVRLLHNEKNIFVIFRVEDRYMRSVHTQFMDPVCEDSCVEVFLMPHASAGYFNFEFNCGGTLLASYVTDPERTEGGLKKFTPLSEEDRMHIGIYHSMPSIVEPELTVPTIWILECSIPLSLIEHYTGHLGPLSEREWTGNFYKCGDATSHPHWASWMPLTAKNFHLPECFGRIRFKGKEKSISR